MTNIFVVALVTCESCFYLFIY